LTDTSEDAETPSLRLARYLKEFVGLRTTTVRDVDKYESVLWFSDMPQVSDCRSGAWTDEHDPDQPWLEVRKQEFRNPPAPPPITTGWVDERALRKATPQIPPLRSSIFVTDDEAALLEEEAPPRVERFLSDHPEVSSAYETYRPNWEAWAEDHRRRESVQRVYADLFRIHTQLQKEGEIVELVLGLGLIEWRTGAGARTTLIRRHAVSGRVDVIFDPRTGVIRVEAPGDGARLRIEDDMLEPDMRPDRSQYAAVTAQLDEVGDAIWDRPLIHGALKTWSGALSADSIWAEGLEARSATAGDPVVSFAPALILRKRLQTGMARIYERLIENLAEADAHIPDGWGGLTDDDWRSVDGGARDRDDFGSDGKPRVQAASEIYFPLPANREQRRIVQALEGSQGVLVQGPPGTGKSHTIANLMCHLLATGQRLLITAETGRALQVLKAKLPTEIQPLCVSLLGQGGDAFAELNAAVQGITQRQASFSADSNEERIAELDRDLDHARRQLAGLDDEIRSLRQDETAPHALLDGAYQGTASKIAARVDGERMQHAWLDLEAGITGEPTLSNAEAMEWLEILRQYPAEDVAASKLQAPESADLPLPASFAAFVENEGRARANLDRVESLRAHAAFAPIRTLSAEARGELEQDLRSIDEQRLALQRRQAEWLPTALRGLLAGRNAQWKSLLDLSESTLESIEHLAARVGRHAVSRPQGVDLRKLRADADAARAHLEAGGSWKRLGVMTPSPLKGRTYLKTDVLVDGLGADDPNKLSIVRDELDLDLALTDLIGTWKDVGLTEFPSDRRLCIANLKNHVGILEDALAFADACALAATQMSRANPAVPVPDWLGGEAQQWINLVQAAAIDVESGEATRQVEDAGRTLALLAMLPGVHPVVAALQESIAARNVTRYGEAYERVRFIEETRQAQDIRARVESKIKSASPRLAGEVGASLNDALWDARLAAFEEAWRWAVTNRWLEKRSDLAYQQGLWKRRHETEASIGQLLSEAAALRAWAHFFKRLSKTETNALKGWLTTVGAMGKGTGKSAKQARLRQAARSYMDACRDAIPIWIMPRYLVAEMIDPTPGRYDLVIVDEASQLGIESLFLFYISNKMIVVGDNQQISPAGVGIADADVAGLQRQYLEGLPHQVALSPQSSLYDNARIRFNQNIVLREHFRCMPEIIQFSNDLCYASNGTPLDPLRAYPANRLEPLVLRHVADGYRQGSTQHAQNPPEAEAIVEQICACIDDPRYAGLTMGVISLQGEAQAKLIESLLLGTLDPEVIEERRIICGDAYAFQGDERHVIFLSMVAAPGETRIGVLSNEAARQRFNVAVSRAQDQIWLFHTAQLDALSDGCMRHRLLSYMLEPHRQASDEDQQRFDSEFERHVYQRITARGFHVRTQVCVGDPVNHRYRIDLVVEGMQGRLAVECDGDEWHGMDRYEKDMARQRDLERAGWQFVRIRGGDYYRDPEKAMEPVWAELERLGIRPGGVDTAAAEPPRPKSMNLDERLEDAREDGAELAPEAFEADDQRLEDESLPSPTEETGLPEPDGLAPAPGTITTAEPPVVHGASQPQLSPTPTPGAVRTAPAGVAAYREFEGRAGPDPKLGTPAQIAAGLRKIVDVEGPMLAKRAYSIYLRGSGYRRMGGELKKAMNKGLNHAIRGGSIVKEDELAKGGLLYSIVRAPGSPGVVLRTRGPRDFEEIPPSELQLVARRLARDEGLDLGSEAHLRAVLEFFDLKRLTVQVNTRLLDVLTRSYPYVDHLIGRDEP
jgi:very-short-patch-repair endonuclease